MKIIQKLLGHPMIDRYGNCYGMQPSTASEIMDKINELAEVINDLQPDIAYLKDQDVKRKKYKVIRRYDILLLAKQIMKSGESPGLCGALSLALSTYGLKNHTYPSQYFPLYGRDKARRFGANKGHGGFWWKINKFGILSGRRMYLNWLIRKYRNDSEILNTIEIYD